MKKRIHDKKGGIRQAHAASKVPNEDQQFEIGKMDTYLDNLTAAATQEKAVLEELVSNNTKLIRQLEVLTKKFEQLTSQGGSSGNSSSDGTLMLNGKKLKLV